jgi:hypothetical protein
MPCTSPFDAWPPAPGRMRWDEREQREVPDRRFVFSPRHSYAGAIPLRLPCGQCQSCRLEYAGGVAVRAVHEAQMFRFEGRGSSFVTFTFAPEHLPADGSVSVEFVQRLLKRLRHEIGPFRYLLCGEYSDPPLCRPHYHAILFGHDFLADRYLWSKSPSGGLLYRSPTLERVWTWGHVLLADYTHETGGYVARYTVKKAGRESDEVALRRVDPETGEVWQVRPEFLLVSRRPGLGFRWFERFGGDLADVDFIVVDGRQCSVPRYYLEQLPEGEREALRRRRKSDALAVRMVMEDPAEDLACLTREERAQRVRARQALGVAYSPEQSERRLLTKHESQALRARRLVRGLDAAS